jgi:SAM-dependent methyltransferase
MSYKSEFIKDVIQWDVVNWSKALRFWDVNAVGTTAQSVALELGSYQGGLSLWMALKGASVVCSDLTNPESSAGILHRKYNANTIQYETMNATDIPYENHFDFILFKSILGGIGRNGRKDLQIRAMEQIYRALKPGGKLLFAENLAGCPVHRLLRGRYVSWGKSWRYITIGEAEEFCKDFNSFRYITRGFLGTFGKTEVQREILGWIDSILLDNIIPKRMRYILIAIAEKRH